MRSRRRTARALPVCLFGAALVLGVGSTALAGTGVPRSGVSAPYFAVAEPVLPPLRLIEIDVRQAGDAGPQPVTELDSTRNIALRAHWLPTISITSKARIEMRVWSEECTVSASYNFNAGPADAASPWKPGCLEIQEYDIDPKRFAASVNGNCAIVLSAVTRQAGGMQYEPLQELRVYVSPLPGPSGVAQESLDTELGAGYARLDQGVRLCGGARYTFDVPEPKRTAAARIAIVSAFSYGSVPQDGPVCSLRIDADDGKTQEAVLRSGVDTARTDFDYYPADKQNHAQARIIESADAGYVNLQNRPFQKHKYVSMIELAPDVGAIRSVTVQSENKFVFDIYDIALLPKGAK